MDYGLAINLRVFMAHPALYKPHPSFQDLFYMQIRCRFSVPHLHFDGTLKTMVMYFSRFF